LGLLLITITTMGTLRANGTPTGVEVPQLAPVPNAHRVETMAVRDS
jgi:hypothetical protein